MAKICLCRTVSDFHPSLTPGILSALGLDRYRLCRYRYSPIFMTTKYRRYWRRYSLVCTVTLVWQPEKLLNVSLLTLECRRHRQYHPDPSISLSLSLSLYVWPSTGRSTLHAHRFVATLQASEGEPCARGDLLHPAFSWTTWLSPPGVKLSWALSWRDRYVELGGQEQPDPYAWHGLMIICVLVLGNSTIFTFLIT